MNSAEYGYTYKVNEKSDVYSFRVVLMELVSRKKPIDPEFGDSKDIVSWVCSKINKKESVLSIVDPRIPEALKEDAIKVLRVAILCTTRLPAIRPAMRTVVHMLEKAEPCKLVKIVFRKKGQHKIKEADKEEDLARQIPSAGYYCESIANGANGRFHLWVLVVYPQSKANSIYRIRCVSTAM
ncbi:receptor-like protein kinase HAIKU2 [Gossypium australe]|uniref:Receptor-like protein kinase HAIKU2 n=1 Tax=Gossypium australe TaxID=47621 RepID=A0A5B6WUN6_9ROSI|nr:receptor-like protein kinase HAIKU2 [Gossypium australe]